MSTPLLEKRSAIFSPCRRYRHLLRIVWDDTKPLIAFVGLNPSMADEFADDPTIVRCKGFAADRGYGGLLMLNLFALKATDPMEMRKAPDAIGPIPDVGAQLRLLDPRVVVVCWGTHGKHLGRGAIVAKQILSYFGGSRLLCFGKNADGTPKHPLYLRSDTGFQQFEEGL
jgi:hypothetical protein